MLSRRRQYRFAEPDYPGAVPRAHDLGTVRRVLNADPVWAVYALADLAPGYREHAEWHVCAGCSAVVLVYRAFTPPVLFAAGPARELIEEVRGEPCFYLSVPVDFAPLMREAGYEVPEEKRMWRMAVAPDDFRPVAHGDATRLSLADGDALDELYRDGEASGEAPRFHSRAMIESGVYFGVHEGGALIAAAGTHVFAPAEGVAAIGNVYTRRDRRGRGLAARTTSAVTASLLSLPVVALNVEAANATAVRVYERLGFRRHCEYREGLAYQTW